MGIYQEVSRYLKSVNSTMLKGGWRSAKSYATKAVPRGNLAFFAGAGAVTGAGYGLADNIVGQDRVSVLGGAVRGATVGAGLYGARGLFRAGRGTRLASRGRGAFKGSNPKQRLIGGAGI